MSGHENLNPGVYTKGDTVECRYCGHKWIFEIEFHFQCAAKKKPVLEIDKEKFLESMASTDKTKPGFYVSALAQLGGLSKACGLCGMGYEISKGHFCKANGNIMSDAPTDGVATVEYEEPQPEIREAVVTVTNELLAQLLFPKGTTVVRVLPPDPRMDSRSFCVTVRHRDLELLKDGESTPRVDVEVHQDENGKITSRKWVK